MAGSSTPDPSAPKTQPARIGNEAGGSLFSTVGAAIKANRLVPVDVRGFTATRETYRQVLDEGGLLIGFEVGYGQGANNTIGALRPIYLTKDGEKMGQWQGPAPASPATFKAKEGYVVGAIKIRTGLAIDGFSMTFVKMNKDQLIFKDNYESEWIGGMGGSPAIIAPRGGRFVGITGHLNRQGSLCSLGLIAAIPKR